MENYLQQNNFDIVILIEVFEKTKQKKNNLKNKEENSGFEEIEK